MKLHITHLVTDKKNTYDHNTTRLHHGLALKGITLNSIIVMSDLAAFSHITPTCVTISSTP